MHIAKIISKKWLALFVLFYAIKANGQNDLSLTKNQMFADFDSLIEKIVAVSPHIPIKRDLWNYDAIKQMRSLRSGIDTITSDFSFYILIKRVLNSSQDMHTSYIDFYPDEMQNLNNSFRMYMPVSYVNGDYIVREPFSVGQDTITTGMKITYIDDIPVDEYVNKNLSDFYCSYDVKRKKFYYPGFFKNFETLFKDEVKFVFVNEYKISKTVTIKTKEKFNYVIKTKSLPDTTKIELWAKEKILYIRLVAMDRKVLPYLTNEIEKYRNYKRIYNKIIIDIRNNGGGEDTVWMSLYSMLLSKPIIIEQNLNGYLYSADLLRKDGRDINAKLSLSKNSLLKKYNLYEFIGKRERIEPFSNSINFSGKIFVLADKIYSSAGSCVAIANASFKDNLISIGRKSGHFLGIGYSPLRFELPNSKFTYRIAPSISSSSSKKLEDLMQDTYQYEISGSIEEFRNQEKNYGHFFSKEYLIKYDPFVKKALSM